MELVSDMPTEIYDNTNFYKLGKFKYLINQEVIKGNQILVTSNFKLPKSDKYYFKRAIIYLDTFEFISQDAEINIHEDVFGNPENEPRLKGVSVSKKDQVTTINKGVFTSCNKNEKCPPWAIQADEIIHDKINKQMKYNNATLKIFDVPVLYFPKFFHPDPTVKRQSGFLQPKINTSTLIGNTISTPYFHSITENKDLTIKPTFSIDQPNIFEETNFFQSEYRQKNKSSSFIADFGFVNNFKSKYSNKSKNILHLFAKSNIDLELDQFNKSEISIFIEKTNKDTYLKIFDNYLMNNSIKPKDKNILFSGIDLRLNDENLNLETGFSAYEDLNKRQSDRYQYVLPYYRFNSSLNQTFGRIEFSSNEITLYKIQII